MSCRFLQLPLPVRSEQCLAPKRARTAARRAAAVELECHAAAAPPSPQTAEHLSADHAQLAARPRRDRAAERGSVRIRSAQPADACVKAPG